MRLFFSHLFLFWIDDEQSSRQLNQSCSGALFNHFSLGSSRLWIHLIYDVQKSVAGLDVFRICLIALLQHCSIAHCCLGVYLNSELGK